MTGKVFVTLHTIPTTPLPAEVRVQGRHLAARRGRLPPLTGYRGTQHPGHLFVRQTPNMIGNRSACLCLPLHDMM
jgi:hypothetical protein